MGVEIRKRLSQKEADLIDAYRQGESIPDGLSSKESIEFKKGEIIAECPVSSNVDELMKRFKIDPDYWDITKKVINEWGSAVNYNRQCKAWLSAKGDILDWGTFKEQFMEDVRKLSPPVSYKHKGIKGESCLEIDIFDLHLGKLGWKEEVGENYDNKIARKRFMSAIHGLYKYAKGFKVDKILFPVGNDFFNSDSDYPYPQTTAGTPQENDLRWQKSYRTGRKLICEAIDTLSQIAPVHVPIVPGNHDLQKSFYLGDLLDVKYENNANVTIDNTAALRKYFQYHNNMIGFAHGRPSNEGEQRLLMLMPQEQPIMFSKTKFREWHLGDIHHKKKVKVRDEEDFSGIVLRYMRTMKGTDSWENSKGFKGAIKGAEAYVWDKNYGMIANFNYNIIA